MRDKIQTISGALAFALFLAAANEHNINLILKGFGL